MGIVYKLARIVPWILLVVVSYGWHSAKVMQVRLTMQLSADSAMFILQMELMKTNAELARSELRRASASAQLAATRKSLAASVARENAYRQRAAVDSLVQERLAGLINRDTVVSDTTSKMAKADVKLDSIISQNQRITKQLIVDWELAEERAHPSFGKKVVMALPGAVIGALLALLLK